ncbi:DUF6257 family protein [Streptomyces europaeiscabiei]|uniref:DUF6257 family protein n=1 Tax=Streptomyces europaeiscabiei TaxID=146819 RepID=UPI0029B8932F|nr:DUF6257 family protein [Streptomyces europaeiscabiei]MDX3581999.1 DUF6257 family protein [Streptomyces europaeiscabiei]
MTKSNDLSAADLTFGEKARIGVLIARMAKRGAAGPDVDISDLKRRVERIENQALRRKNK